MAIVGGWVDWAEKRPGPDSKQYQAVNQSLGIVFHSMEGWMAGSLAVLADPAGQSSWMFSVGLKGECYQHYPVTGCPWASGSQQANTRYWSVESEGQAHMPLNGAQVITCRRLIAEFEAYANGGTPAARGTSLLEHREVATRWTPNAGPTACPSERYAPLWESIKVPVPEVPKMSIEDRISRLERLVAGNGYGRDATGDIALTGEDALVAADRDGASLFLGLGDTQAKLIAHNHGGQP